MCATFFLHIVAVTLGVYLYLAADARLSNFAFIILLPIVTVYYVEQPRQP